MVERLLAVTVAVALAMVPILPLTAASGFPSLYPYTGMLVTLSLAVMSRPFTVTSLPAPASFASRPGRAPYSPVSVPLFRLTFTVSPVRTVPITAKLSAVSVATLLPS